MVSTQGLRKLIAVIVPNVICKGNLFEKESVIGSRNVFKEEDIPRQ